MTITKERLEQLADTNTICKVSWDERLELARIALAAMDKEPVVPEEMYWQDAPVDGSIRAAAYAKGWNACRAAMLSASPQESKDG